MVYCIFIQMKRQKILSLVLILMALAGCVKKEDNGDTDYNFQLTPRGESEVLISWSEEQMGRRVNFTLASTADFSEIISQTELEAAEESVVLDGLSPLKNYFLKIEVFGGIAVIWSQDVDFTSGYTMEAVSYETSDGLEISCVLHYISAQLSSSSKRIIFMHEYGATKSSWISTALIDSLVKDGNLCATFDFRGHGASDRRF